MDKIELQEIIEIIEKTEIDVLHIEKDTFKLYYQKNGAVPVQSLPAHEKDTNQEANNNQAPGHNTEKQIEINSENEYKQIVSPMIGTYYGRPEQEGDPFVIHGDHIEKGQTVCMLEAMKLFNEVRSELEGEIVEIHAQDGDIIEYGQPLFTVKVSE